MRPGPAAASIRSARTAKLGLNLATFAGEVETVRVGGRNIAAETLHAAARAGVEMFHGPEGSERLMQAHSLGDRYPSGDDDGSPQSQGNG